MGAVDMVLGIIVGTTFGRIVSSFFKEIIIVPIGLLIGDRLQQTYFHIKIKPGDVAAVPRSYGTFIQTVISFTIIAFMISKAIKATNLQKRKEEFLLFDIRDILKENQYILLLIF